MESVLSIEDEFTLSQDRIIVVSGYLIQNDKFFFIQNCSICDSFAIGAKCNECRFDHRSKTDWVIEGVRDMGDDSVISANKYELPVVSPAVLVDSKFVSE